MVIVSFCACVNLFILLVPIVTFLLDCPVKSTKLSIKDCKLSIVIFGLKVIDCFNVLGTKDTSNSAPVLLPILLPKFVVLVRFPKLRECSWFIYYFISTIGRGVEAKKGTLIFTGGYPNLSNVLLI